MQETATIMTDADRDTIFEAEDSPEPADTRLGSSTAKAKYAEATQERDLHAMQDPDTTDPPPPYEDLHRN